MSAFGIEICFICEQSLNEGEILVVKERGVKRLQEVSSRRKNPQHQRFLSGLSQIKVHKACQKSYTNERMIAAYVRHITDNPDELSSVSSSVRSKSDAFDFKNQCFLCGEGLPEDFQEKQLKLPASKRNFVHKVMKLEAKNTFMEAANKRSDEWALKILERIRNEDDLVAVDAWYHRFCNRKLYQKPSGEVKSGRPPATNTDEAMEYIYNYLEENGEECQFPIEDLMKAIKGDVLPDIRTVKSRISKKYGEDVLILESVNKEAVICFRNLGYKILSNSWYENRMSDPQEERLRIIKTAADIILQDIRSQVYNTKEYPPSDNFLSDVNLVVPKSLALFFESIILRQKRGLMDKGRRNV